MFSRFILFTLTSLSFSFPSISSDIINNNNSVNGSSSALSQSLTYPDRYRVVVQENKPTQASLSQETSKIALNPVFADLQKVIGYHFHNVELLILALRHSSTDKGHTLSSRGYERLEFFGDGVLEYILRSMLWYDFPHLNNGELRNTCSKLVENSTLATVSELLRLPETSKELGLAPPSFNSKSLNAHGKADFVESLIAAIYEDGGIDAAKDFIHKYWRGKSAPGDLTDIFTKLNAELMAIKEKLDPASQKLLTRLNYDKKYDDSVSFLGEGVLGLALKRLLCRLFPEASEGDLTKKFTAISSNKAIDNLCKLLHPGQNRAFMKKYIGELFIAEGLEKTSTYILTAWTSERAPVAIQKVINKNVLSNEMMSFVEPARHSSFLISSAGKKSKDSALPGTLVSRENSTDFKLAGSCQKADESVSTSSIEEPISEIFVKGDNIPAMTANNSVKIDTQAIPDPIKTEGPVKKSSKKKKAKKFRTPQQLAERKENREKLKIERETRRAAKLQAQMTGKDVTVKRKPITSVDALPFEPSKGPAFKNEEAAVGKDLGSVWEKLDGTWEKKDSLMTKVEAKTKKKIADSRPKALVTRTSSKTKKQWAGNPLLGTDCSMDGMVIKLLDPKGDLYIELVKKEKDLAIKNLVKRGNEHFLVTEYEEALICFNQALANMTPDLPLYIETESSVSRVNNFIVSNIIRRGAALSQGHDHEQTMKYFEEELSKFEPESILYQEAVIAIANYKASLEIVELFGPEALWSDDEADDYERYTKEDCFQPKNESRKEMKVLAKKKAAKTSGLLSGSNITNDNMPKSLGVEIPKNAWRKHALKQEKNNKTKKKVDVVAPMSFGLSSTPADWTEWLE